MDKQQLKDRIIRILLQKIWVKATPDRQSHAILGIENCAEDILALIEELNQLSVDEPR